MVLLPVLLQVQTITCRDCAQQGFAPFSSLTKMIGIAYFVPKIVYGPYQKSAKLDIGKERLQNIQLCFRIHAYILKQIWMFCKRFYQHQVELILCRDPKLSILNKMSSSDHLCRTWDGSKTLLCEAAVHICLYWYSFHFGCTRKWKAVLLMFLRFQKNKGCCIVSSSALFFCIVSSVGVKKQCSKTLAYQTEKRTIGRKMSRK